MEPREMTSIMGTVMPFLLAVFSPSEGEDACSPSSVVLTTSGIGYTDSSPSLP